MGIFVAYSHRVIIIFLLYNDTSIPTASFRGPLFSLFPSSHFPVLALRPFQTPVWHRYLTLYSRPVSFIFLIF